MLEIISKDKYSFGLSILFVSLTAITMALCPFLLGATIDYIIAGKIEGLIFIFSVDVLNILIMTVSDYASIYYESKFIRKATADFRIEIMNKLLKRKYFITTVAEDISCALNTVDMIKEEYLANVLTVVFTSVQFIFCLALLSYYSIFLGVVSIIFSMMCLLLPRIQEKRLQKFAEDETIEKKKMYNNISEIMKGRESLTVHRLINFYMDKCSKQIRATENSIFKKKMRYGIISEVNGVITQFAQRIGYLIAGFMIISNHLPISFFTISGNYVRQISECLKQCVDARVRVASVKKMYQELKNQFKGSADIQPYLVEDFRTIRLENIGYKYDEFILRNLNLEIKRNSKIVILGESGKGKSTLLKIVSGFYNISEGNIYIDKEVVENYRIMNCGYLSQDAILFTDTIRNNILLDKEYDEAKMKSIFEFLNLKKWVDQLENKEFFQLQDGGRNVSGGQAQRICLARELYQNRNILLIDEGLSAVESELAYSIEKSLLENEFLTIVSVTHHLNEEMGKLYTTTIKL